ncbi:Chromosome partitioning ATPase, Mrp family, contains Fe-S cluster [Afipia sp. GAS231]|nr:Chromosome partitioning ATPase, Mrp family, contains Fe-S cluster [Afipia sp. GAS231]
MEALAGKRIRPLTALSPDLAQNEQGLRLTEQSLASHDSLQTWKQMLDSVRKYRQFIVRTTVVGAALAGLAGLLMQPSYMATAQLTVDVRQLGAADASGAASTTAAPSPGAEESVIDTHVTVLLSDAYLRRLLPALRALDDARPAARAGSRSWTQGLRAGLGNTWSATKRLMIGEPDPGEALASLKRGLKVGQERRSKIISVTFVAPDPQRAADVANIVAKSYVDELVRQRQGDTEQVLNSLATQSARIQQDLATAEEQLNASRISPASASRDSALEWRVTTLAQQFETLLRRQEQTAKSMIVQPDVSLLAAASPPDGSASLHPLLIVPPAAIALALLACFLAVVFNRFDRTLHTEIEAADVLHIPCAGLLPAIPPGPTEPPQYVLEQPASPYSRTIRSILVSILASDSVLSRSQRIVLVSSSVGGEGKTTLAWSLGLYAARLGWRTLLLDFGQIRRRPGDKSADLLSVLSHGRPLADAVQHIQESGIDYLPAVSSDGSQLLLLANSKVSPLLRQLSEIYDFVIIDGPSLQESPEARLLTGWADHVLFAVHCGSTSREMAQAALHQLAQTEHFNPGRTTRFSSVLTRAEPSQPAGPGWHIKLLLIPQLLATLYQRSRAAITWWTQPRAANDRIRAAQVKPARRSWFARH